MEKGRQWEHVEGGCEAGMAWRESPKESRWCGPGPTMEWPVFHFVDGTPVSAVEE